MSTWLEPLHTFARGGVEAGWLPASLGYAFVVNALIGSLLIGPLLGGLGPLVVAKRLAFFAQAIGQAAITGIALGLLLGEPADRPFASLFAFCTLFALALTYTRNRTRMPTDTLIAVFLSLSLAAGACLLPALASKADAHLIEAILFGSILTVDAVDLGILLVIALVVGGLGIRFFNAWVLSSLNPGLARVRGLPVVLLDYVFVVLVTLVTVASVKIVGAILVEALLIIPAAAARNVSASVRGFYGWSIVICTASCVAGILIPLALDLRVPSGAAIILTAALAFAVSLCRRGREGNA